VVWGDGGGNPASYPITGGAKRNPWKLEIYPISRCPGGAGEAGSPAQLTLRGKGPFFGFPFPQVPRRSASPPRRCTRGYIPMPTGAKRGLVKLPKPRSTLRDC